MVGNGHDVCGLWPVFSLGVPADPRLGFLKFFPRCSFQSGGCWCPTCNNFTPIVAFREPRIEDAICHVRDIICPLVTCKGVDHREALGGGQESASLRRSAAQQNIETISRVGREFSAVCCCCPTGRKPRASLEPGTACSSSGRTEWPSGQSVSGMGELVCAGWEAALCQRG